MLALELVADCLFPAGVLSLIHIWITLSKSLHMFKVSGRQNSIAQA